MRKRLQRSGWQPQLIAALIVVGAAFPASAHDPFGHSKSEHWGVIARNTIGSPVAQLRDGPFVPGPAGDPPFGKGSLGIEVANNATSLSPPSEKVDFGNEVDFFGAPVSALNEVGFFVFQTGENAGINPRNMPNIRLEIDPDGTGGYTTMVWVPDAAPVTNRWSDYIDATTTGDWYFTGGFGTSSGCSGSSFCTFAIAKSKVPSGKVYSVAVGKGRDNLWVGAVDGLRLNGTIFDFEAQGVRALGGGHHGHHH